jgi:hypothetical protein
MERRIRVKTVWKLIFAACVIAVSSPAFADIINGGFEEGTFNGWTTAGKTSITSASEDPRANGALSAVGNRSHSAMVGDPYAPFADGYWRNSSVTQTWAKSSAFSHLYFNWAAVALVPVEGPGGHDLDETPWFQIQVRDTTTNATLFSQEYYSGSVGGGITPGWLAGSTDVNGYNTGDPGIWYYRPWNTFDLDLAGIADGDLLQVTLTTRDCTLGGHSSYAYLDGFASVPNPIPTPEPTAMFLLGLGLVGMAGLRRKFQK